MKSPFFSRYVSGYIFYYNIDMTNREYILNKKNRQPMISQGLTASHLIVGATGFEPATSASRTQRSTKLSHASIFVKHFVVSQIVLNYIITSFSVCPEKFCIFLIFLKFQTKPPKFCDILCVNTAY